MSVDDVGLASERAQLARQRTALALVTSAAIATRFSVEHVGLDVSILLGVATLLATWVFVTARRDYGRRRVDAGSGPAPALHLLALAATVVLVASAELAAIARR